MDITLPIIFIFAGIVVWVIIKESGREEKVEVLYGYPAYRKTWLTIYHDRRKDKWIFEWDDLFDSGRPADWGPISQCMMFEDKKSGATKDEYLHAWRMLKHRDLM